MTKRRADEIACAIAASSSTNSFQWAAPLQPPGTVQSFFSSPAPSTSRHYPNLPDNQYAILKQIRRDLQEADVNQDGKIDFEELKLVLSKYPGYEFTPQQIEDIGELFYVGRSGGSVKHATFMRGIQHIIATQYAGDDAACDGYDSTRQSQRNPLAMESVEHQGCWVPSHASQLHNVQQEFENSMWKFVQEIHALDQAGGKEAVQKLSDKFYDRVTSDERLKPFFEGKSMEKLKKHPYNFMRVAFSSSEKTAKPEDRDKNQIRRAHARLEREKGLKQYHFDLMLEHFVATLKEEGNVTEDLIDTAVDVVMTYRDCFAPADEYNEA